MWWDGMKYKEIISWVFVLIWMIIIYCLSSQSATESSLVSSGITDRVYQLLSNVFKNIEVEALEAFIRNIAHFTLYFILGFLLLNALHYNSLDKRNNLIITLLVCIPYSISDEIHQLFVPGRAFQISDIIIDILGSLTGIWGFKILIGFRDLKRTNIKL